MIRKFFKWHLELTSEGKPLARFRPLITALDTFFFEAPIRTSHRPHIRDSIDLKRWMLIVVFALVPCILMAIWNTGMQSFVYSSENASLVQEFYAASHSFKGYFGFAFTDGRWIHILNQGALAFLPVMIISYAVGGLWEGLFAVLRGHEISEGFLVTGVLFALILPPTIPYWMVALGVTFGVVVGKELFGGTGMNILNPALTCRCFLFFSFPTQMSGNIWCGTNATTIQKSILGMNKAASLTQADGISQSSVLSYINISPDIKRIHVDAIAAQFTDKIKHLDTIKAYFAKWASSNSVTETLEALSPDKLKSFLTTSYEQGGLGLSPENYFNAASFAKVKYALGHFTDGNFFFGNILGSMGETSTLACLLGAAILIYTGIGSWRSIVGMFLGAFGAAALFQLGAEHLGVADGLWNPAKYTLPAYKHLLLGGLAFGAVFMATDPVSSPYHRWARWVYGLVIGAITVVIRVVNPAFPEGVMLAILFGNVFAPLIDHYALTHYRKVRRGKVKIA